MHYTLEELTQAKALLRKRRLITYIPFALIAITAIVVCVLCQMARMEQGWLIVSGITIVAGAYLIFFWDVYLKPAKLYQRHVDTMLNGRLRHTKGQIKELSPDLCDKDGLRCYQVWINVGDKGLEEDDRLFYLEGHKPLPNIAAGTMVEIVSNDKMISSLTVL